MKKSNQKVDIIDLTISAGELDSALIGLSTFVSDNFDSAGNITRNDIDGLNGLVKAIECLADKHYENMGWFAGGLEHE